MASSKIKVDFTLTDIDGLTGGALYRAVQRDVYLLRALMRGATAAEAEAEADSLVAVYEVLSS